MNIRFIHILTLIALAVVLSLAPLIAAEDAEFWGLLQWYGFALTNVFVGAVAYRSICRLLED